MIHIAPKPEPVSFNTQVRTPGNRYLQTQPQPNNKGWNKHSYWTHCLNDLYSAYGGICAYTGMWFPNMSATVDHFFPKSTHPQLAYEWANYRLTSDIINNYKDKEIVIDPFSISDGDIILDIPSCQVKPRMGLSQQQETLILFTINQLKLNSPKIINDRFRVIDDYVKQLTSFDFLERRYPFIHRSLQSYGSRESIQELFKPLPCTPST